MRIGISGWSLSNFVDNNEFKIVDYAKKLGYSDIDLSLEGVCYDFTKVSESAMKKHYQKVYEYAKENNITINQTHASYASFPNFTLEEYFKKIVRSIKCTSYVGAKYMIMHPQVFPKIEWNIDQKELQYNIEFYKRLIPYLKKYDVKLCLENIYDWEGKPGQRSIRIIYYSAPQNLKELVDKLNSEYIGVCLDTGHMHIAKENMYNAIKVFGDKLWALHIHDCYGIKDDHFIMYDGSINWEDVRNGLKDINYNGVYSLELKPISSEEEYYIKAYNDAKNLVGNL